MTTRAVGVLVLLGVLVSLLTVAAPAAAAASCGKKVLDDWYDGRIDGSYPLHCYDDAIEIIPRDVRDYSSAQEDIERALQARLRNEKAPLNADPSPAVTKTDPEEPAQTNGAGATPGPDDPVDPSGEAAGAAEAENVSSVPIPLLVLAALALLLVLGGSAGYLVRRYQARRIPPPAA